MGVNGMHAVDNPNAAFLASRASEGVSSVVGVIVDGNRPLMGEVQVRCCFWLQMVFVAVIGSGRGDPWVAGVWDWCLVSHSVGCSPVRFQFVRCIS